MRNTQLGTNFWSTGVISHSSVCFCTGTETFFDLFENESLQQVYYAAHTALVTHCYQRFALSSKAVAATSTGCSTTQNSIFQAFMHLAKWEHLLRVFNWHKVFRSYLRAPFHRGLEIRAGCRLESAELSITESNSPSIPRQKRKTHKHSLCSWLLVF